MCGRYAQTRRLEELAKRFRFLLPDDPTLFPAPSAEIFPTQPAAVVRSDGAVRRVEAMRWGLVPSWSREAKPGFSTINARVETLEQRPAFRDALVSRRCLVLGDAYFEWRREGKAKQRFRVDLASGEPFAMAGLWDAWRAPDEAEVRSFAIVTAPAAGALAALHDRVPVILRPGEEDVWLDPRAGREALARALEPVDSEAFRLLPPDEPHTPTFL